MTHARFDADGDVVRTAVDSVATMIAYWDQGQRCRFANRAYERWFGISPEALIGMHIRDLLGPLYALNLPYIEGALRGEPQEFEREIPDPRGGPPRHGLANYVPHVVQGTVRGFVATVTDITRIMRAEEALRSSEEQFRLTLDEAPIGMALVGVDGHFLRVNRALCDIVGYPAEELTGLTFQAITHPADLDADLALMGQLRRGEIPRYTLGKRYIRKDGSTVDVMLSGSVLRAADGRVIHYIAQVEDVTASRQLERALRLAEARSSGILAVSADAIISIDAEQRITLFNHGAQEIFGYTAQEMLGRPLDVLIPERFRAVHRRHVAEFAAGPPGAHRVNQRGVEIFARRRDGSEFPADAAISKLDVDGQALMTVTLRDISAERRMQHEQSFLAEVGPLLAASLDYEATLECVGELAVREIADLCIIDLVGDDDRTRRLTVACRDPDKCPAAEFLRRVSLDRSRPHLMHSVLSEGRALLMNQLGDEEVQSFAQSREHLDALRRIDIRSLLTVPLVARGRLLGGMALISSTPSRLFGQEDVRLAEELAQRAALAIENAHLYRVAQQATRTRDDVLGVVAHDLRGPLHGISIQASILGRLPGADDPRSRKAIDGIQSAVKRMDHMVRDLLDMTSLEAGHLSLARTRISPARLVVDAVEAQEARGASAGLEIRREVAPGLADIFVDRNRLLQVFENLIGNAVKFTPPGGCVTVRARQRPGEVVFEVADNGPGIPESDIPRLFDRFWQAVRSDRKGAGLGLPIVKALVEGHGGQVHVESVLGQGTTFSFTIPALHPDAP